VALTADGRRAVSASEDRTLRVRDLKGADEITFIGEVRICSCAVTPDGQTIVAGDASGHVHFLRIVEAYKAKPSIGDTARTS
jgi:WD40 repeat protein